MSTLYARTAWPNARENRCTRCKRRSNRVKTKTSQLANWTLVLRVRPIHIVSNDDDTYSELYTPECSGELFCERICAESVRIAKKQSDDVRVFHLDKTSSRNVRPLHAMTGPADVSRTRTKTVVTYTSGDALPRFVLGTWRAVVVASAGHSLSPKFLSLLTSDWCCPHDWFGHSCTCPTYISSDRVSANGDASIRNFPPLTTRRVAFSPPGGDGSPGKFPFFKHVHWSVRFKRLQITARNLRLRPEQRATVVG